MGMVNGQPPACTLPCKIPLVRPKGCWKMWQVRGRGDCWKQGTDTSCQWDTCLWKAPANNFRPSAGSPNSWKRLLEGLLRWVGKKYRTFYQPPSTDWIQPTPFFNWLFPIKLTAFHSCPIIKFYIARFSIPFSIYVTLCHNCSFHDSMKNLHCSIAEKHQPPKAWIKISQSWTFSLIIVTIYCCQIKVVVIWHLTIHYMTGSWKQEH